MAFVRGDSCYEPRDILFFLLSSVWYGTLGGKGDICMKRVKMRFVALVLVLCMLLSGCELSAYVRGIFAQFIPVSFSQMEYTRPDLDALNEALEAVMACVDQPSFRKLERALMKYSLLFREFSTNYALANIYYCKDMTDLYWSEEYNICLEMTADAEAGLDQLMYALAESEHREKLETEEYYGEGYFDDYEGESLWDDTFTELMNKESEILAQYYTLSAEGIALDDETYYNSYVPEMCEIYTRLVALRQEIATYAGYESYPNFAYDFYYSRDYTPAQERAYLAEVRAELVPIYRDLLTYGVSGLAVYERTEAETYAYVEQMAQAMGGTVLEAFELMADAELYDITYSENKYNSSFEVYLSAYSEPYILLNPQGTDNDALTFAHEFGHFCNDYASYGSGVSVDVAEVFSQGMEYLSLFYAEQSDSITKLKMVDSLCVYVEQSAYADFEQRVYALKGDEITSENIIDAFASVIEDYGFDLFGMDVSRYIEVPHFFTNPCYIFSYVVSNDAAMQFYQMEAQTAGDGLAHYTAQLDTLEYEFLAFIETADLESPFADGRLESVRDTFRSIFY